MNILIVKDYEEMSRKAAHMVVGQILQKPGTVLGLATGSSPIGLYRELIKFYNEGMISFGEVVTFNLDEYIGLDRQHKESYAYFMEENLFRHIDIRPENHHIPSGNESTVEQESRQYDRMIAEAGGIDFQILGIGRNGHIGFNEPDIKFEAKTHRIQLDEQTISDNARFFSSIDEVPKSAITMGVKTIMQSRGIILLAFGQEKAKAVQGMIEGCITPELPASVLQLHPNVTVIADEAAAALLSSTENMS